MTSTPDRYDVVARELSDSAAKSPDSAVEAILHAVSSIAAAADPHLVFQAVAQAAVPSLCDVCTVELISGPAEVRIEHPADAEPADHSVLVPIIAPSATSGRPYGGTLTLRFRTDRRNVASRLVGELLVGRAIELIERERLLSKTANLEQALISNREIGVAIGILVNSRRCTQEQAFSLLRQASQNSHRKLAAIAADLTLTGVLEERSRG